MPRLTNSDPTRVQNWREIFGEETVWVLPGEPVHIEDSPDPNEMFYWMDLRHYTKEEREHLATWLAQRFLAPLDDVWWVMTSRGVPISAAGCSVVED